MPDQPPIQVKHEKTPQYAFLYPLLLGIYPVIALLANNIAQIHPPAALRAGILSLAGCVILYAILYLILRSAARAALLSTLWLFLFYSYGHVYEAIEGRSLLGFVYGKHRFLVVVWLALLAAGSWLVLKKIKVTLEIGRILNTVSVFEIVFPLFQIGFFEYHLRTESVQARAIQNSYTNTASTLANPDTPDIYYLLLDGYSRADVIQKLYNLDTSPFIDQLKSMGFVVSDCAQSNYGITALSMFATLNMNYLDAYGSTFPLGSNLDKVDFAQFHNYLSHNQVRQYLKQLGYNMVTFETGWWWLDITDADKFIVENNNPLTRYSQSYSVSNFEELFVRTTALRVLSEANTAYIRKLTSQIKTSEQQHYDWVKFELDELDKVPEIPGKKFVYFHVLAPHDPFVFDANGNFSYVDADIPGYPDEVSYLNQRVLQIVQGLLAKSKTPPIIVIQGDHGWDPRYRMYILNAYYLPNGGSKLLYPTITPVNTFRLIFNKYFGGNFKLLPDASYFSMEANFPQYKILSRPYQLKPVPNACQESPN